MTIKKLAFAAMMLWTAGAVTAHASPAGDYINGRHWLCDGNLYSIDTEDNRLPYRLMIGANAGADGTFNDVAFINYSLDGQDYMSAYDTSGYLFDNDTDGAGLYFEKVIIDGAHSDSLYDTPLRWSDHFTLNLHAVANSAGDEYAYHLEGQRVSEEESVTDLTCHVFVPPTDAPAF